MLTQTSKHLACTSALVIGFCLQPGHAMAQANGGVQTEDPLPENPEVPLEGTTVSSDTVSANPVTESDDAFGQQVGPERTGLYNSNSVRGFNPVDAGNVRIESLYFDQVSRTSQRLMSGTAIRVGLGTQGYAFPAPTGLVDYSIRSPREERSFNLELSGRPDANEGIVHPGMAWDLRYANILPGIGLGSNGFYRQSQRRDDVRTDRANFGLVLSADLPGGAELLTFGTYEITRDDEARPTLFPVADALPPEIKRFRDFTQPWADTNSDVILTGAIARIPLGDWRIETGLFFNRSSDSTRFADLMSGVAADGSVDSRTIVADGDRSDQSLSGEFRVVRAFAIGASRHQLSASFRGRERQRRFGGARRIDLGTSTILGPDIRPLPQYTLGEKNVDDVRQLFFGVAYSGQLTRWLNIDLGASQIDYRKTIDFVNPASTDLDVATAPIAWNAAATLAVTSQLTLFGSVTRGMEEAEVAPDIAINRDEAPAAINTRQEEIVLRYQPTDGLTLLAGAFRISKPFYNLDPQLRYRLLGTVVNEGLEFSAVARPVEGLTLIGGAVISDPLITGEIIDSGVIGPRPIGQTGVSVVGNIDWRFDDGNSPLSLDAAYEYRGSRTVNTLNTLDVPGADTIDLGFRYRFDTDAAQFVLRGRLINAFNTYDWDVFSTGGLFYTEARTFLLQLNAQV